MPLLGNVVISKNFLRTRKIMVMHSNERGECNLHTLVDRKRKRYHNAVDVVGLHGPADQAPKLRHLRVLAHVQLDDDPPPPLLYIRGGGHPLETQQLIIDLLAMCGAPLHYNPPR